MTYLKWVLGLCQTVYVWFLISLAIAMCLTTWSWLDMRVNSEGIISVSLIFCAVVYVLYSLFRLLDRALLLFWQKRPWSEVMIWSSIGLIVVLGLFQSGRLAILPASLFRDSVLWGSLTLEQVNVIMLFVVVLGYVCHYVYHRLNGQSRLDEMANEQDWRKAITTFQLQNIIIVLGSAFVLTLLYFVHIGFQEFINEASTKIMQGDIEVFRDYLLSFGVWAPIVSGLLMIFVLVVAPPLPAFVVTFTNGLLFGAFWGTLLSWSSAMLGALLCFYIARALGRPAVERFFPQKALHWTDRFFERYGIHAILLVRLIPVMSFALVSYAAGLTAMRFTGYFVATGLGQLPATVIYSWLGENATGSVMYVFWAFIAVIIMAVLATAIKPWFDKRIRKVK